MKVITTEGFKLPYLGKERYIELLRIGVRYEKKTRTFFIQDISNVDQIKKVLSEILKDDIAFAQKCIICKSRFVCEECEFTDYCETKNIPMLCICRACYSKTDFAEEYFVSLKNQINNHVVS